MGAVPFCAEFIGKQRHFIGKRLWRALPKTRIDFGAYRTTSDTLWRPARRVFQPKYQVAAPVQDGLRAIERADQDLRRFEADEGTAHRLLRDALTRNAFGTASIEGNPLTLAEVDSLLAQGPTPDRAMVPDEREILNYADFVRGLDATPFPRDAEGVRRLHAKLFAGVLPRPGRFKTRPNFIGQRARREVMFVPTMPERVERELEEVLSWSREAVEHPIVRAAVLFHEFQSIHPFDDGNGRLGRALTTLFLWHQGYPGVRYALVDYAFNQDRETYYDMLDEPRRRAWDYSPWLAYMVGVLCASFEDAVERFLFRGALPEGLNDRQARIAAWIARLDRGNRGRKLKLNDVHAAFPEIPGRTLTHDLRRLVDAGLLRREGERKAATYTFVNRKSPRR
jgi:cell filamentation protein, protein adenylyltransferase